MRFFLSAYIVKEEAVTGCPTHEWESESVRVTCAIDESGEIRYNYGKKRCRRAEEDRGSCFLCFATSL